MRSIKGASGPTRKELTDQEEKNRKFFEELNKRVAEDRVSSDPIYKDQYKNK